MATMMATMFDRDHDAMTIVCDTNYKDSDDNDDGVHLAAYTRKMLSSC